jgi:hypothetical protein
MVRAVAVVAVLAMHQQSYAMAAVAAVAAPALRSSIRQIRCLPRCTLWLAQPVLVAQVKPLVLLVATVRLQAITPIHLQTAYLPELVVAAVVAPAELRTMVVVVAAERVAREQRLLVLLRLLVEHLRLPILTLRWADRAAAVDTRKTMGLAVRNTVVVVAVTDVSI